MSFDIGHPKDYTGFYLFLFSGMALLLALSKDKPRSAIRLALAGFLPVACASLFAARGLLEQTLALSMSRDYNPFDAAATLDRPLRAQALGLVFGAMVVVLGTLWLRPWSRGGSIENVSRRRLVFACGLALLTTGTATVMYPGPRTISMVPQLSLGPSAWWIGVLGSAAIVGLLGLVGTVDSGEPRLQIHPSLLILLGLVLLLGGFLYVQHQRDELYRLSISGPRVSQNGSLRLEVPICL